MVGKLNEYFWKKNYFRRKKKKYRIFRLIRKKLRICCKRLLFSFIMPLAYCKNNFYTGLGAFFITKKAGN